MADKEWSSPVNEHSDEDCWCRGTHAEGLHALWERRREADQAPILRARLAEVEADHAATRAANRHVNEKAREQRVRAEAAEARLAEVEALCDRMRAIHKDCPPSWVDAVRAVARGEGDRPADLFARQVEIREGAITEIAETLGRCPQCGAFGVDRNNHCGGSR